MTNRTVDHDFLALPFAQCQDAALSRARELGAGHADVRIVRLQNSSINLRDARLDGNVTSVDSGLSVRVLVDVGVSRPPARSRPMRRLELPSAR